MPVAERESRTRHKPLTGHARPRLAPPVPARSELAAFRSTAEEMGISLMPWQDTAGRYLTAIGPDGRLLYREVCILVARQNGKTTLAKPYIVRALRAGKKVMHIAQNRELPRHMFGIIADAMSGDEALFPKRRGRTIWPRYGSGQEEIALVNGGAYRIAAASRGGARGHPNDIVIIDELREMDTFEVIGAAEPTLTMSEDPQIVYFSNEGDDTSVVLNAVRDRAGQDDSLAFLSWSAAPEREADDREGWAEANPALGHYPSVLRTLESAYRRHRLAGTMSIFETEHLCRRVVTMQPTLVNGIAWQHCRAAVEDPVRPIMAVSMDSSGRRAAAVLAWQQSDDTVACRVLADVHGDPIDSDAFGRTLKLAALRAGVSKVRYSAATDAALARYLKNAKALDGREYANATGKFVQLVDGNRLRWDGSEAISEDLGWLSRRMYEQSGMYIAVKSNEDHPAPAAFAAIRAVWEASQDRPAPPRIY